MDIILICQPLNFRRLFYLPRMKCICLCWAALSATWTPTVYPNFLIFFLEMIMDTFKVAWRTKLTQPKNFWTQRIWILDTGSTSEKKSWARRITSMLLWFWPVQTRWHTVQVSSPSLYWVTLKKLSFWPEVKNQFLMTARMPKQIYLGLLQWLLLHNGRNTRLRISASSFIRNYFVEIEPSRSVEESKFHIIWLYHNILF